jgi:selenium metabolism protein YedF
MARTIDARGLNCPQPVILTKKVMDETSGEEIMTIVDNSAALENISKLAANQGYSFSVETQGTESYIHMIPSKVELSPEVAIDRGLVILVKSQYFGEGDQKLGAVLMKSWAYTLTEISGKLKALIFMNAGIHLTTDGSPILEHLTFLEEQGVEILSCGTCLDFFNKKDHLKVGQVTNMSSAMELLSTASKTIVI